MADVTCFKWSPMKGTHAEPVSQDLQTAPVWAQTNDFSLVISFPTNDKICALQFLKHVFSTPFFDSLLVVSLRPRDRPRMRNDFSKVIRMDRQRRCPSPWVGPPMLTRNVAEDDFRSADCWQLAQ